MGSSGCLVTYLLLLLLLVSFIDTHCPSYCPPYNQPVCGSNGKTYHSYCELQRAACRFPILGILLTKVHDGPCGVSVSVVSVGHVGQCVHHCHDRHDPVCGSNGITYSSECRFKQASCRDRYLTIRHRGHCEYPVASSGCNNYCHGRYNPVCGSDGLTYNSECELRQAACRDHYLRKKHNGPCGYNNKCHHFYCAEHYDPVCGSDGLTYSNECKLKQASCAHRYLTLKYRGSCGWGKKGPKDHKPLLITDVNTTSDGDKTTPPTPTRNNT